MVEEVALGFKLNTGFLNVTLQTGHLMLRFVGQTCPTPKDIANI